MQEPAPSDPPPLWLRLTPLCFPLAVTLGYLRRQESAPLDPWNRYAYWAAMFSLWTLSLLYLSFVLRGARQGRR